MKVISSIASSGLTLALVLLLNTSLNIGKKKIPRLGEFFSPQHGFWRNAESINADFNERINSAKLQGKVEVFFDKRLVPHVYAEKESDAYFVQGYLHAKFRLWQMEFQTHIAAGRLSEIMGEGESFISKDRFFKRLGMVAMANESLKVSERNPSIKEELDAYTQGVNAYIESLDRENYPLEYKILDYRPEKWTNLKTQLLLKYMAFDLAGYDTDFEMTNVRRSFSSSDVEKLFPTVPDSLAPILSPETPPINPRLKVTKPETLESNYFSDKQSLTNSPNIQPDEKNGSNNWAVSGSKTRSGAPILCNDPHLGLNLPSLWYEMQISTPTFNSYGATIPGAPSIIIGFNDYCAWGVTNASRDVKDYYEISFKDSTMQEYLFKGTWRRTSFRYDTIKVKGELLKIERIALTTLGPVLYDKTFPSALNDGKYYAVRWTPQEGGNELLTFNKLNHAKDYNDYIDALRTYASPGQNFIFASKTGDIALKQQGRFPAKWARQGDFLMPGTDSSYAWQGYIPFSENPSDFNPQRGFVSSANQLAAKDYPYYLAGRLSIYRGITINRMLARMSDITMEDMKQMQVDNYDSFAEQARPLLLKYLNQNEFKPNELIYATSLKNWNSRNNYEESGPTVLDKWWKNLKNDIFSDEFRQVTMPVKLPDNSTLLEALLRDSTFKFVDNVNTPQVESLRQIISSSYKKTYKALDTIKRENNLKWGRYKNTEVKHILGIPAFSKLSLPIGGGQNCINAASKTHGPGWRMIVELTSEITAYGIYAGGQSGNPGSSFYDNFIDNWAIGRYYKLLFLNKKMASDSEEIKWKMEFTKG